LLQTNNEDNEDSSERMMVLIFFFQRRYLVISIENDRYLAYQNRVTSVISVNDRAIFTLMEHLTHSSIIHIESLRSYISNSNRLVLVRLPSNTSIHTDHNHKFHNIDSLLEPHVRAVRIKAEKLLQLLN